PTGERDGSGEWPMRNAEFGMRNRRPTVQFRIPHSAFRIPSPATAPATVRKSRRSIVLAPPRGAVYIMRPPKTLEGVVVDALRSPYRAARRQAPQGHLSLGSRDRHSLRRVQGDGEGHEFQRDRGSR